MRIKRALKIISFKVVHKAIFSMADILSDLTNLVTPAITFISQKGDLIYDNLCSDFHEGKALYITNLRTTKEKVILCQS